MWAAYKRSYRTYELETISQNQLEFVSASRVQCKSITHSLWFLSLFTQTERGAPKAG